MKEKIVIHLDSVNLTQFEIKKKLNLGNFFWLTQCEKNTHVSDFTNEHLFSTIFHIDSRIHTLWLLRQTLDDLWVDQSSFELPSWANIMENLIIEAFLVRQIISKEELSSLKSFCVKLEK